MSQLKISQWCICKNDSAFWYVFLFTHQSLPDKIKNSSWKNYITHLLYRYNSILRFVYAAKDFAGSTLPLNIGSLFSITGRYSSNIWLKIFRGLDCPIFLGILPYFDCVDYCTKKGPPLIFNYLSYYRHSKNF